MFAAAVGEKYEWYPARVEELQRFGCTRDGYRGAKEDAIDTGAELMSNFYSLFGVEQDAYSNANANCGGVTRCILYLRPFLGSDVLLCVFEGLHGHCGVDVERGLEDWRALRGVYTAEHRATVVALKEVDRDPIGRATASFSSGIFNRILKMCYGLFAIGG